MDTLEFGGANWNLTWGTIQKTEKEVGCAISGPRSREGEREYHMMTLISADHSIIQQDKHVATRLHVWIENCSIYLYTYIAYGWTFSMWINLCRRPVHAHTRTLAHARHAMLCYAMLHHALCWQLTFLCVSMHASIHPCPLKQRKKNCYLINHCSSPQITLTIRTPLCGRRNFAIFIYIAFVVCRKRTPHTAVDALIIPLFQFHPRMEVET